MAHGHFMRRLLLFLLPAVAACLVALAAVPSTEAASSSIRAGCVNSDSCREVYAEAYGLPANASNVRLCFEGRSRCATAYRSEGLWYAHISTGRTVRVGKTYSFQATWRLPGEKTNRHSVTKRVKLVSWTA